MRCVRCCQMIVQYRRVGLFIHSVLRYYYKESVSHVKRAKSSERPNWAVKGRCFSSQAAVELGPCGKLPLPKGNASSQTTFCH